MLNKLGAFYRILISSIYILLLSWNMEKIEKKITFSALIY